MEPLLRVDNLTKRFGSVIAVNNVSLDIVPGSFLTLLGLSVAAGTEGSAGRSWPGAAGLSDAAGSAALAAGMTFSVIP